jgi:biopolymer transport protein ExbB/TolQ
VYKLDSGLFWYDTLAQICTYIGLLGTIIGLIQSFQGLAASGAGGSEANAMLTEGIQKAISATAMGLAGAIPLTLIKGGLLTKAQKVINDIDEFDVKMINQINNVIKD